MPQLITPAMAMGIFKFGMGLALSQAASYLFAKDKQEISKQNSIQANIRSTKFSIPLLYGKSRPGTNEVYIGTSGNDNKYLHIVKVLGEGEIEGINQVDSVDQLFLDDKIYTEYGGNVYYEIFTGSPTQNVCATLNSAIPEWTDPLRYTAYIYVRLTYDSDYFQNIPAITVGLKGLKVKNPTTTITEYNNTPALCTHDMVTRSSQRGGMGINENRFNIDTIEDARSYCVTKGWTCNMSVRINQSISDNVQLILNNFRGELFYSANKFSIKYRDLNYEVVVKSFDDDRGEIIDKSLSITPGKVFDMPNAIKIIYTSEQGASDGSSTWKEKEYVYSDKDTVESDGDYREFTIQCLGLSDLDAVQKMAQYYAERERAKKTFSLTVGSNGADLEPMDLIKISHPMPGWVDKYSRIKFVSVNPNFETSLICEEEFLALYDDIYDPQAEEWYDTILPSLLDEPYPVINVSHSEEVYFYRERSFTRWIVDFDPPDPIDDPFYDYTEVYLKIGSSDYIYMTRSGGNYIVDPVEEGETYYLKMINVRNNGRRQLEVNAVIVSKTIIGKTSSPSNLDNMTAAPNGDSVSIFSNPIQDPDNEGYEVRLGDAWDGAIFISFNKNCSLRLNGVRPGEHVFWMSPKDNSGNYSDTPVFATAKVFIPPGYTSLASWSLDFSTGTFSNTEQVTYDSKDALKCSHTGDVLTGTWEASAYDLGSVQDVRVWGDFLTEFVSSSTTWDGVAPDPVTWDDLGSGLTWNEIFNPIAAGKVQAILKYSTDNIEWHEISFFEILCAEISARWIKVEVQLTDPTLDANLYLFALNMKAYTGPQ